MKNVFIVLCLFVLSCCDPCEVSEPEANALIKAALLDGSAVTVWEESDHKSIEIDGIIQFTTSKKALTTGCFSIPTCVRIDDDYRGIIKISEDDFIMYDEKEFYGSSVTYILNTSYSPYWVGNGNATAFRNVVKNHGGGAYENKRKGCCANNPSKCHCVEMDTDTDTE